MSKEPSNLEVIGEEARGARTVLLVRAPGVQAHVRRNSYLLSGCVTPADDLSGRSRRPASSESERSDAER